MLIHGSVVVLSVCLLAGTADTPPRPRVHFTAAPSVSSIAAGSPFDVVCTLTVPPKWHIYWKDPGSSGMATRVRVEVPSGFKVGPVRFPRPVTVMDPAGAVNALDGRVHLALTITPPATLETRADAEIRIKADWLICRDVCFLGAADVTLQVPLTATPGPETTAASWIRGLPRPIQERPGTSVQLQPGPLLRISGPRDPVGAPGFVQESRPGVKLGTPAISTEGSTFVMNIPMAYDSGESLGLSPRIRGLVCFGTGRGDPAWEVDLPFDPGTTKEREPSP
jgi:thiol:disulfide interchange protein DsbD